MAWHNRKRILNVQYLLWHHLRVRGETFFRIKVRLCELPNLDYLESWWILIPILLYQLLVMMYTRIFIFWLKSLIDIQIINKFIKFTLFLLWQDNKLYGSHTLALFMQYWTIIKMNKNKYKFEGKNTIR